MKVGLDTSVLVQALTKGTEQHATTLSCYEGYRTGGAEFVIVDHALLEAFSVLSRSPRPVGIPAAEAERALVRNFGAAEMVSLQPGFSWGVIRQTLERGHWGGRVHDSEIALAAFQAGASVLLTWNVRHFHSIAPHGLEIRSPAETWTPPPAS